MALPPEIQIALNHTVARQPENKLHAAATSLTNRYRDRHTPIEPGFMSESECLAYLAMRLPATYEACRNVFSEITRAEPADAIQSMLDVGSGPGTGFLAAAETFGTITQAHLMEPSKMMAGFGADIIEQSGVTPNVDIKWSRDPIGVVDGSETFDLVLASYVLGEIRGSHQQAIKGLWSATNAFLVLIEPGSRQGFARIRAARDQLIEAGGHIVAPCTHAETCPISGEDWCHFTVSVQRSSLHRRLKSGSRGDESEKFSYLIASRQDLDRPRAKRIIKRPLKGKGHVHLDVCGPAGLERQTLSKRDRAPYKLARKARWGDLWPTDD